MWNAQGEQISLGPSAGATVRCGCAGLPWPQAVGSTPWLNEKNATSRTASQFVQNSDTLLWSEGFYRGYMNVAISYDNITTT